MLDSAMRARSCETCMRSQVSAVLPKAFASRTAISTEMAAFSLTRLLSAWRLTPRARAPSVTVRPSGSRHSSRTIRPGWGGFFICMADFSSPNYSPINGSPRNRHRAHCRLRSGSDAPILAHGHRPGFGHFPSEFTQPVARQVHGLDFGRGVEREENVLDLPTERSFDALRVPLEQLFERFAPKAPNHSPIVA